MPSKRSLDNLAELNEDRPDTVIPKVICRCCDGTGHRDIEPGLWVTLKRLRRRGEATAGDLVPLFAHKVGHTAINNRMGALHRLGLAKRVRKQGKEWVWKATSRA